MSSSDPMNMHIIFILVFWLHAQCHHHLNLSNQWIFRELTQSDKRFWASCRLLLLNPSPTSGGVLFVTYFWNISVFLEILKTSTFVIIIIMLFAPTNSVLLRMNKQKNSTRCCRALIAARKTCRYIACKVKNKIKIFQHRKAHDVKILRVETDLKSL